MKDYKGTPLIQTFNVWSKNSKVGNFYFLYMKISHRQGKHAVTTQTYIFILWDKEEIEGTIQQHWRNSFVSSHPSNYDT
jgi:hypothetical protein